MLSKWRCFQRLSRFIIPLIEYHFEQICQYWYFYIYEFMFWNSGNGSNDIKVIKMAALTLMSSTTASWRICKKQRGKRLQMPCSHEHLQTFSERQTWGIRHAKAQSNCRGAGFRMFGALRKRSWRGAMRSFLCMYQKGGTPMGHQRLF